LLTIFSFGWDALIFASDVDPFMVVVVGIPALGMHTACHCIVWN
jgi:hypothetical protein